MAITEGIPDKIIMVLDSCLTDEDLTLIPY